MTTLPFGRAARKAGGNHPAGRRGYTLAELLVATSVGVLLGTLALGIVSQVVTSSSRASAALAMQAEADAVFDRLVPDLESLVYRRDEHVWFAATLQDSPQHGRGSSGVADADWTPPCKPGGTLAPELGGSLALQPSSNELQDMRFGQAGMWLRFFTIQPDSGAALADLSAPRAVSYQIVRRRVTLSSTASKPTEAPFRYLLYRSTARPAHATGSDLNSTFAVGYDLFMPDGPRSYNRGDASLIDQVGNVRTPRRYEQLLANNVIDFGVRIWCRSEDGRLKAVFPGLDGTSSVLTGFAATIRDGFHHPVLAQPPGAATHRLAYGFPATVDVAVRVLSPEGARRIEALESRRIPVPADRTYERFWWQTAERHSRVFVRRVTIGVRA